MCAIAAFRSETLCSVARRPPHLTVFAAPSYARRRDHAEAKRGHGCNNDNRGAEACAHSGGAGGLVLSGLERHPVAHAPREGIPRSDIPRGIFRCDRNQYFVLSPVETGFRRTVDRARRRESALSLYRETLAEIHASRRRDGRGRENCARRIRNLKCRKPLGRGTPAISFLISQNGGKSGAAESHSR